MYDLAWHHKATVRAGQFDEHRENAKLSSVRHDSKIYYYDLLGLWTFKEFEAFVLASFDPDNKDLDAEENAPGTFTARID